MATTLTDPLIGQVVDGRYEVLSKIARGGMATVYRALDRRLDRQVALKVMHPHLADGRQGAEFVARFRREARAAARLTHPGVVAVFDQGVDGETSYLTMELVEGHNLRRHLEDEGPLPVAEALRVAEAVLEALATAHRAGLVHRDVKPENVLLGAEDRVKVADFGLARAVTEVTSTTTGTVMGTVAYLAPELVSRGVSDPRTDVYAVGILLYEMVTGHQPFTGHTPVQVAYRHVHEDVPAPSAELPWVPAELDDLLVSLTAREPVERPADAQEALTVLRRARAALDDEVLDRRASAPRPRPAGSETDSAGPDGTEVTDLAATSRFSRDGGGTVAVPIGTPGTDGSVGTDVVPAAAAGAGQQGAVAPELRAWRRRVAVLLVLIGLAAGLGIGVVWWATEGPGAWTTVPEDVVGAPLTDARQQLATLGLDSTVDEAFDPEVAAGVVLSSEPAAGEAVRRDGSVELLVSLGPDLRPVPELVGLAVDDAVAALRTAGLEPGEVSSQYDDDVPEGQVMVAGADPGQELAVGSTVDLVTSDGPAPVTVISVVGAPEGEAVAQLEADGLRVDRTEEYSDTHPAGVVAAQEPAARTEVRRGDVVQITVSLGPPLVEVPDVVGDQFGEARQQLEGLGFVVVRENVMGGFFGTVRSQDTSPGEAIPRGSTIVLTVV